MMNEFYKLARKLAGTVVKKFRGMLNAPKKDVIHCFLLSPPLSGSTLVTEVMGTSPKVTVFPGIGEGHLLPELKNILLTDERWNPDFYVDWLKVRQIFLQYWSPFKKVRFEKSPPHLVRALDIERSFENAYFLVTIRNPYAQIEGILRREWSFNSYGPQLSLCQPASPKQAAEFWVRAAKSQIDNIGQLKNVCFFRYEDLADATEETLAKIINFVPSIGDVDIGRHFNAHNVTGKPIYGITNLNQEKIASLSPEQIAEINGVLEQHLDVLAYFQYQLLDSKYLKAKDENGVG